MSNELPPKSIVQSKTAWGALALLVSYFLQQQQLASTSEAEQVSNSLLDVIDPLGALIGFILVIWGRVTAKRSIKLPG